MCVGQKSELDFSAFLLKLDVPDKSVFAGVACFAHQNHEKVSNFQKEFSWWAACVQH